MVYRKVLRAIVCGYERGGTTLLSQVLSRHPLIETGFESGLLLADTPRHFLEKEFSTFNGSLIKNGWGLSPDDLQYIVDTENWNQTYLRLRERSRVVKQKNCILIDKTPAYMEHLDRILLKIDETKALVIIKQPLGVIWSWVKRRISPLPITDIELRNMCRRYMSYAEGYKRARQKHPRRVMMVKYGDFCRNPEEALRAICDHLDLEFHQEMLRFDPKFGVYGSSISAEYIDSFVGNWTQNQIDLIHSATNGIFDGY